MRKLAVTAILLATPLPASAGGPFDHLPVLERTTLTVTISPERVYCMGMMPEPFPCFEGTTKTGRTIRFDTGISGYTFREGRRQTIRVEEIRYDFSGPQAPMDTSSIRYVLKK
ncbi:DUF4377 domain-containing protein [Roseibium sediminis]|uniref:DUF4377 domain-containing protein n=1 Tax=Roseibium sediminis TaxID=1775174 RepID=UPI00123D8C11|nr:DUF4377 domain-containing protein [Roseibium sediminis]